LHTGGTGGNATGRNIFTHPLAQAVAMTQAISALTIENKSLDEALKLVK
jgi:DhnA family fructose-bisphosphate aldolase class Ia